MIILLYSYIMCALRCGPDPLLKLWATHLSSWRPRPFHPFLLFIPSLVVSCGVVWCGRQIAGHLDLPVKRLQHYLELTKESVSFEVSYLATVTPPSLFGVLFVRSFLGVVVFLRG